jgi:hypothetical protein
VKAIYSLLVIIGISIFGFAAAHAMPQASLDKAQAGITIPVAGGCGAAGIAARMADAGVTVITAVFTTAAPW